MHRAVIRLSCWFAVAALVPLACNGDEPFRVDFDGQPGQSTPITLDGWVPMIHPSVDGTQVTALIDTGAPFTAFTPSSVPGASAGETSVELEAFGLTFPRLPVVMVKLFEESNLCQPARPAGLLGGEPLRAFRLGLDYREKKAFLFDNRNDDVPPWVAGDTNTVEIGVVGGGLAQLSGLSSPVKVGPTRVVVDTQAEGQAVVAIVDTGASLTVVSEQLYNSLNHSNRPVLCCESVATLYGSQKARLTRLRELRVGGAVVKNLPVIVWDQQAFFDALSAEVGEKVSMLIGGSFLRRFAVELDYRGKDLRLSRYKEQDHVDQDEFVGPGFTLCQAKNAAEGMVVVDVFQDSSADKEGIQPGQQLIMVEGVSLAQKSLEEVWALLRKSEGSTVNLIFSGYVKKTVKVERLLPDY